MVQCWHDSVNAEGVKVKVQNAAPDIDRCDIANWTPSQALFHAMTFMLLQQSYSLAYKDADLVILISYYGKIMHLFADKYGFSAIDDGV